MKTITAAVVLLVIATSSLAEWHSDFYKKADAIVLVSIKKRGGNCDKYCEDILHVERVYRNVSKKRLKSGDDINVRSYSWTKEPPAPRFQVFLKSLPKQGFWQLVQDSSKFPTYDGVGTPCNDKGGRLHQSCQMPDLACVTPYSDGGKKCSDKADCQGACVLEVSDPAMMPEPGTKAIGVCRRDDFPCGCLTEIVAGKTTQGLCTD